ncbi:MAG: NADH:ubiquinone reductase (Na(+)-transporting) subunit C [Deltaproteobacteria bacterium]|nr:NADH:ubiquinone reductase (Na(+)-transporting) subunit C [Deltaproteobacteria bacterium]
MQSNGYVVGFAAIICVVCALLLSGVSSALKEKQEENRVIDRQKNILVALGWSKDEVSSLDAPGVTSKYKSGVQELVIDRATGVVVEGKAISAIEAKAQKGEATKAKEQAIYKRIEGDTAYAFPFTGKGLWSTLYGYMALKSDGNEIVGVTYYKHGETPGLGAEIEADWFLNNFKGKKLYKNGKFVGIKVAKGLAKDQADFASNKAHMVDGMSGATLTGNGVGKMMRTGPRPYFSFFKNLKNSGAPQ